MNVLDVLQYIIMPIVSAIIGGLLTFFGVFYTIKFEQNKSKKNEKMLNKPYLKISFQKGQETIHSTHIENTFNQNNIDNNTTYCFYTYLIDKISIINSSNADCILKEFVVDDVKFSLNNVLILKNEIFNLDITRNNYVNSLNLVKNMYISVLDILGNTYYYKCDFKAQYENEPIIAENNIKVFKIIYTISNISLPISK